LLSWASEPINAGNIINTAANELFPTYYEGALYFSSNGHEGLGGLDIYKYEEQAIGTKGKLLNLGYPINTNKDEFGFSIKNNKGYFSSNRYGSDDIFEYNYALAKISLKGKIETTNKNETEKVLVKIYSNEEGMPNTAIDSSMISANGNYVFSVRPNRNYLINVSRRVENSKEAVVALLNSHDYVKANVNGKLGFEKTSPLLNIDQLFPKKIIDTAVEIKSDIVGISKVLKKVIVYYPFDQSVITKEYKNTLDSAISYLQLHPALTIVIGSFTDCAGTNEYNEVLSKKRSIAVIKYLSDKGIGADRVVEGHYGKSFLKHVCDESKYHSTEQWQNRRSEIFITEMKGKDWEQLHDKGDTN